MQLRELPDPTSADVAELGRSLGLGPELTGALSGGRPRVRLVVRDANVVLTVRTHALAGPDGGRGEVTAVVTPSEAAVIGRHSPAVLAALARFHADGPSEPAEVVFALVEVVVDAADEVLERLDAEVERIEEGLFGAESADHTEAIHAVKRELLEVRRSVVPLVVDVARLSQEWSPRPHEGLDPRFAALGARAAHAAEGVEHLDALTSSVLAAQLAQIGVRQSQDQRRISAWAAIALVPTGVGAVYGMNFEHMPELTWELGYPAALLTILALCTFLYVGFRRNGWL